MVWYVARAGGYAEEEADNKMISEGQVCSHLGRDATATAKRGLKLNWRSQDLGRAETGG